MHCIYTTEFFSKSRLIASEYYVNITDMACPVRQYLYGMTSDQIPLKLVQVEASGLLALVYTLYKALFQPRPFEDLFRVSLGFS